MVSSLEEQVGLFTESADSYRSLLPDFGSLRPVGGMPFGAVAWLELASSLLAVRDTQTWVELHRGLLRMEWTLTRPEFDLFTGRIRESVEEGLPDTSYRVPSRPTAIAQRAELRATEEIQLLSHDPSSGPG